MIRVTYFIVCLLLGITLVSCIRDEALNAEADILTCTVPGDILKRDPIIENNKVVLMVTADADLTHQAPEFTLTPGATISPASGTERDFTTPQFYTVTSEDGNWKKEYQVTYIIAGISSEYHFENVKDYKSSLLKYVYNIFYENDSEGKWVMDWASGNTGFALTGAGTEDPASFPTSSYAEGKMGKCVKLETKSTGDFGSKLGMPIAAGNLFMGTFSVGNALTDPLKATMFGVPFEHIPTYLKGYYKYKAGEVYKDENGNIVGGETFIVEAPAMSGSVIIKPTCLTNGQYQLELDTDGYNSINWMDHRGETLGRQETIVVTPRVNSHDYSVVATVENGDIVTGSISLGEEYGFESITQSLDLSLIHISEPTRP